MIDYLSILFLPLPYMTSLEKIKELKEKVYFKTKMLVVWDMKTFSKSDNKSFWPGINNLGSLSQQHMLPKHTGKRFKARPKFTYFSRLRRYSWRAYHPQNIEDYSTFVIARLKKGHKVAMKWWSLFIIKSR